MSSRQTRASAIRTAAGLLAEIMFVVMPLVAILLVYLGPVSPQLKGDVNAAPPQAKAPFSQEQKAFALAQLDQEQKIPAVAHHEALATVEWSVGAVILFGQILVKFVMALAKQSNVAAGPLTLVVVVIIVFGLLPSLYFVVNVTQVEEVRGVLSKFVEYGQIVMFFISTVVYIGLGLACELLLDPGVAAQAPLSRYLGGKSSTKMSTESGSDHS